MGSYWRKITSKYRLDAIVVFCRAAVSYLLVIIFTILMADAAANADEQPISNGKVTPHFVSIKASKMNSRIGPGFDYPILWHYWRKHMPVEVVEQYDQWRKIRDIDGDISWVFQPLLSSVRTVVVRNNDSVGESLSPLYAKADENSRIISKVEDDAIAQLNSCDGSWCYVTFGKVSGYLRQKQLWGVYDREVVK